MIDFDRDKAFYGQHKKCLKFQERDFFQKVIVNPAFQADGTAAWEASGRLLL